jgi:flagellar assembly protein FliH
MSEMAQRKVPLTEVPDLVQRGGAFNADNRFAPDRDAAFTPWNKANFKPVHLVEAAAQAAGDEVQDHAAEPETDVAASAPVETAAPPPPPPPPPEPEEPPPSPEEIIAAIEKAREDGRATGYQQGLEAARKELGDALNVLRRIESELVPLAAETHERNAELMAQHVRRIAQDLFGAVFAEMPAAFVERIKNAAEMFTKAGSEFTLSISPHDAVSLRAALKEEQIFTSIRIIEDDELPSGAFRLASRDLEFDDTPHIEDERA